MDRQSRVLVTLGVMIVPVALAGCGKSDLGDGLADEAATCSSCHGSERNAAPPRPAGLDKDKTTSDLAVGAHQLHLRDGLVHAAFGCAECHVEPAVVDAPGHVDPGPAEITWGKTATADGASPRWDREAGTCASTYCHGATLLGGTRTSPKWTFATEPTWLTTQSPKTCDGCHGFPPPAPHPANWSCSSCHPQTVGADGKILLAEGKHLDGELQVGALACSGCHGSERNAAPPVDVSGNSNLALRSVGAHQAHVTDSPVRAALACDACHRVPAHLDDPGHIDSDLPAEVEFGALAKTGSTAPAWNGQTCASVYCHGATLHGGAAVEPEWTKLESGGDPCGSCHGDPPPAPHAQLSTCRICHPGTVRADGTIDVAAGKHIDGRVDLATGCSDCHGSAGNAAPPFDLRLQTDTTARGVGAHQAHLNDTAVRKAVGCDECHRVPLEASAAGHLDGDGRAELTWGPLATAQGQAPSFDGASCSRVYCHGSTLSGGAATLPVWTKVDGSQAQCDSCHGNPPLLGHPAVSRCQYCHPDTVQANGAIDVEGGKHIDGAVQVVAMGCAGCHGSQANAAPPADLSGRTDPTLRSVGAHQAHLAPSTWHRAFGCADCHRVPAATDSAGHLDSDLPADLTWSAIATAQGSTPSFDGATCSSVYCHGAATRGGTNKTPAWTRVDGTQAACGTCHGMPPPGHYGSACGSCHPTMGAGFTFVDPDKHIDGVVQATNGPCNSCHGSAENSAPPHDASGRSDSALLSVGAHQAHVAASDRHAAIRCEECHRVPAAVDAPGHLDGAPAEVLFGALASAKGTAPLYDGSTCSSTYCHGALTAGGQLKNPVWNVVDGTQAACGTCHGNPPPNHYAGTCNTCHPTMDASGNFTQGSLHVNGVVDVRGGSCSACHGGATNAAPPADLQGRSATTLASVGAHQAHLRSATWHKAISCSECHVVPSSLGAAGHLDASPAELTWGPLARADGARPAYDGATCASVYCHGATTTGGSNKAPSWVKVDGTQAACGTCHGVPPPAHYGDNCGACHPGVDASRSFADGSLHIDGKVDVKGGSCSACHGSAVNAAPPTDLSGRSAPTLATVGAHQAHLIPADWHKDFSCDECHAVPATVDAPGHLGPAPAELTWGPTATADGATPAFDGTSCSSVYCHGASASGGSNKVPSWVSGAPGQAACGTCHGNPPPNHYGSQCSACHPTMAADGSFLDKSRHIDGRLDLLGSACNACHGSAANAAPPNDLSGNSATSVATVGAHQSHLTRGEDWHRKMTCADCHPVPTEIDSPGHLGSRPADLTMSGTYDGTSCSVTCHGSNLRGGSVPAPVWTRVDGTQAQCGACHGLPPGAPHPTATPTECGPCHPFQGLAPKVAANHVNGVVDFEAGGCGNCHQAQLTQGTHAKHAYDCMICHPSPAAGLHQDGKSQVIFSGDPRVRGARYSGGEGLSDGYGSCSDTYCHSDGTAVALGTVTPPSTTPNWDQTGQLTCASCHGDPPSYANGSPKANDHVKHAAMCGRCHGGTTCSVCHKTVVNWSRAILDRSLHANYRYDVAVGHGAVYEYAPTGGGCRGCHAQVPWGAPYVINGLNMTLRDVSGELVMSMSVGTPQPTTARVDYGTTPQYGLFVENTTMATNRTMELRPLTNHRTYYYRLVTTDAADVKVTIAGSFDTKIGPPAPQVVDEPDQPCLSASCAIEFEWQAVTDYDGHPVEYAVEATDVPGQPAKFVSAWTASARASLTLPTGKTYTWLVRARDSLHPDAVSNPSATDRVLLIAAYPPPVPTLIDEPDQIVPQEFNDIPLQWNPVTSPDGHAAEYQVRYGPFIDSYGMEYFQESAWIGATTFTAPSLETGRPLAWSVRARDSVHPDAVSDWAPNDGFTLTRQ